MTHPALLTLANYYRDLSNKAASQTFASYFHLPAALIIGEHKIAAVDVKDISAIYANILARYAAENVDRIQHDDDATALVQIGPHIVLIKTVVSRLQADGRLVKTWYCSYLMREVEGQWKCDVVIATPN